MQGFDQETAAVVMARLTSLKMETEVFPKFQKLHPSAVHFLNILSIFSSPFGQFHYHCEGSLV